MDPKEFKARITFKDGEGKEGQIQALFSHFNSIDQSKDVVLPSFFNDGQAIPMAAWGHDWGSLPPGKGVIRVTDEGAIFDGQFFLNTPQGKAHYDTVKAMGDLQEWSFGFRVLDAAPGVQDGEDVRFLVKGETFEASPVLVGDNRQTYTAHIKSIGDAREHTDPVLVALLDEHSAVVKAVAGELATRSQARNDARAKEGRVLSTANRTQLAPHPAALRKVADEIEALLTATAPVDEAGSKAIDVLAALAETEIILARLNGVAV